MYVDNNVSFADAFNVVYIKTRGMTQVYSFDTDFDKIEGINPP
jgi:predicted nucleic acid-binding protein